MDSPELKRVDPKVLICWPTAGHPDSLFTYDYGQLMAFTSAYVNTQGGMDFGAMTQRSSAVDRNRNEMVRAGLQDPNVSHFMFLDDDMRFPKTSLLRLLERGQDIVGANYAQRSAATYPHAIKKMSMARDEEHELLHTYEHSHGLEKVEGMGMGVVLIRRRVFEAMEFPWFEFIYNRELKRRESEDHVFFMRAREAGFDVHVDHDLSKEVGHTGDFTYTLAHAVALEEEVNGTQHIHGAAGVDSAHAESDGSN